MITPFFPAFRSRLAPMGRRLTHLRQQSLPSLDVLFKPFLPSDLLAQSDDGPNSRERVFSLRRTFFAFLYQVLNPDCSCRQSVRQVQALFALHNTRRVNEGTGAYCQARSRLPLDILSRLRCSAAAYAQKTSNLWNGLSVKVVDGTTVSLPDTPKNQRAYPQSKSQKPGCGFPLLKLVGVFCLSTGALLDFAKGNKRQHELSLLHQLLDSFKPGDLVMADRGFSTYTLLALLVARGAHGLFRLHQARPTDLRRGKRLGKNDRLLEWTKPLQRPRYMPQQLWKAIVQRLAVRVLRFHVKVPGFRARSITLVTTLLDPKKYPADQLAKLYAERWRIELWFRDIKTTMGMEVLRCKTPSLVHKELEMFFVAYNLIRCLMVKASASSGVGVHWLSFKGSVDSLREFASAIGQARSGRKQKRLVNRLLEIIARDKLLNRFGRIEPRAVKRRPKPYSLLNCHRRKFKDIPHRNRYRKASKSKA